MPKVTSKLQLTVPKALADQYGIRPGDELEWVAAGESIRVIPVKAKAARQHALTTKEKLEIFDQSMERQQKRAASRKDLAPQKDSDRGWRREDLYTRGLPR